MPYGCPYVSGRCQILDPATKNDSQRMAVSRYWSISYARHRAVGKEVLPLGLEAGFDVVGQQRSCVGLRGKPSS